MSQKSETHLRKGSIRVGSKRQGGTLPEPGETQIHGDRLSPAFGNPFPLRDWTDHRARDLVIEQFFVKRFAPDVLSRGPIFQAMALLALRLNQGEDLILMCWCAPLKCHCQHIKKGVELLSDGKNLQNAVKASLAHRAVTGASAQKPSQ